MRIDPAQKSAAELHRLLIDVVLPRPIAFVSTVGAGGGFNVAPFSYFNVISHQPPLLGISISHRRGTVKDTLRHIRETRDFVVNVVDEALLARAVEASGDWPAGVDEFARTGLEPLASERVRSPRVGDSPVQLECVLERELEIGAGHLVVGEVVLVHVRDDLWVDGHIDPLRLAPVGRLGSDAYSVVREVLHHARPRVERGS